MGFDLQPPIIWLIIFAVMVLIELLTMGLTSIWFAGGAIVALVVSETTAGVHVQIVLFIVVSVVLLVLVRPWAKKHFNHERVRTNAQSLIGESAVVMEDIDNMQAQGRVLVRGQEWMARSVTGAEIIPKGTQVKIKSISGVKLIVEKTGE